EIFRQHVGYYGGVLDCHAGALARKGTIGWAASPITVTGTLAPRNGTLRSYNAHFSQRSGVAISARAFSDHAQRAKCWRISARSPAAVHPVSFHSSCTIPTMLINLPALTG